MNRRDRDPRDGTGLSSNEEDYLKTVYGLGEWSAEPVTTGALAAKLGVAPASATSMVAKLVAKGLLTHPPYGAVELTPQGRRTALVVVRRHRLLEAFLVGSLGYAWDEVHDEAEVLEHTVSTRFVDRLDALLGRPAADPHGDPIPSADGRVDLPEAARWDRTAEGPVVVVRVSDADPDVLRSCAAAGIVPGAQLDGDNRPEDSRWAAAVWVVPA